MSPKSDISNAQRNDLITEFIKARGRLYQAQYELDAATRHIVIAQGNAEKAWHRIVARVASGFYQSGNNGFVVPPNADSRSPIPDVVPVFNHIP